MPSSLVQPSVDRFSVVKNTFMGGDVWRRYAFFTGTAVC